jgi:hypothetical protein
MSAGDGPWARRSIMQSSLKFIQTLLPKAAADDRYGVESIGLSEPPSPDRHGESLSLSYEVTFRAMVLRRMERRWNGTAKKRYSRLFTLFMTVGMLATLLPYDAELGPLLSCVNGSVPSGTLCTAESDPKGWHLSVSTWALGNIGANCIVWTLLMSMVGGYWMLRNILFLSVVIDVVAVCARGGWASFYVDPLHSPSFWIRNGLQLFLCLSLVLFAYIAKVVLPRAIKRGTLWFSDVKTSYHIRQLGPSRFVYTPLFQWPCAWLRRDAFFEYVGEVDSAGRPDGFGRWADTAHCGEGLKGFWKHGDLVGPFLAAEQATGSGFRAVRIGFCTNSQDKGLGGIPIPFPKPGPLRWGVATVETSINGEFYRHLPDATVVCGPEEGKDAAWCMPQIRHLADHEGLDSVTVSVAATGGVGGGDGRAVGLRVSGHVPAAETAAAGGGAATTRSVTIELGAPTEGGVAAGKEDSVLRAHVRRLRVLNSITGVQEVTRTAAGRAEVERMELDAASATIRDSAYAPIERPSQMVSLRDSGGPLRPIDEGGARGRRTQEEAEEATGAAHEAVENVAAEVAPLQLELCVRGWESTGGGVSGDDCNEAVVFIHGWQSGLQYALEVFAQFLNLAQFPPHIKPFAFAWPCGNGVRSFPIVREHARRSKETHQAFADFIGSLAASGVRKLHILAHSMGGRLFCSSLDELEAHFLPLDHTHLPSPVLKSVEAPRGATPTPRGGRVELASCIFLHPEHDLHQFVDSDYARLRRLCSNILFYMDTADGALLAAEWLFNHEASLGKHPYALVHDLPADTALRGPLAATRRWMRGYAELPTRPLKGALPLDVDVVDISWMDSNVHGPRHNYFNVNRWLIDDILETITTGQRAVQRTHRMTHRGGNVWAFLAAPRHIVNA